MVNPIEANHNCALQNAPFTSNGDTYTDNNIMKLPNKMNKQKSNTEALITYVHIKGKFMKH